MGKLDNLFKSKSQGSRGSKGGPKGNNLKQEKAKKQQAATKDKRGSKIAAARGLAAPAGGNKKNKVQLSGKKGAKGAAAAGKKKGGKGKGKKTPQEKADPQKLDMELDTYLATKSGAAAASAAAETA